LRRGGGAGAAATEAERALRRRARGAAPQQDRIASTQYRGHAMSHTGGAAKLRSCDATELRSWRAGGVAAVGD